MARASASADLAAAEGDQLIEQRQRRRACCHRRPARAAAAPAASNAISSASRICSMRAADLRDRQALEIELQAARQHRHRQLLRIGGREQELHVRRRLLERLQQRVEGVRRQHVHFVDQVDLVAAARRRVLRVVEQLAHVVDLGVARPRRPRCRSTKRPASISRHAAHSPQGVARDARLAVEALGEDARDGGLAHAARAGEQERVMHAARCRARSPARARRAPARPVRRSSSGRHLRASAGVYSSSRLSLTARLGRRPAPAETPAPDIAATAAPFRA